MDRERTARSERPFKDQLAAGNASKMPASGVPSLGIMTGRYAKGELGSGVNLGLGADGLVCTGSLHKVGDAEFSRLVKLVEGNAEYPIAG